MPTQEPYISISGALHDLKEEFVELTEGLARSPQGLHNFIKIPKEIRGEIADWFISKISQNYIPKFEAVRRVVNCEAEDRVYASNPPKLRCKRCGQFWFAGSTTPSCFITPPSDDLTNNEK